jgi:signal transduction histidine kinase
LSGAIRILNPAGRRILAVPESLTSEEYQRTERESGRCFEVDRRACGAGWRCPPRGRAVRGSRARAVVTHLGVGVSPLSDENGQLHGAICLFTDLTAVMDLEEQLRLKDSLATVGELTAGIAHEFRNGLATIQGYSKLLDLTALPEAYRPYVEGIRAETQSLSQVVTNFLQFARPSSCVADVDPGAICERAAEEIRPDARARRRRRSARRVRRRRRRRGAAPGLSNLLATLEAQRRPAPPYRIGRTSIRGEAVAPRRQRQRSASRCRCASACSARSSP